MATGWCAGASTAMHGGGGGADCAPRRVRPRVRLRTPYSTASSPDRTSSCTTTMCCGSACRHDEGVRTRRARGSGSSSREASAALGAPVLEHGAPCASAHPGAKAVLAGTTAVVGLERTLQRRPPRRPGQSDQAGWSGVLTRLDLGCAHRAPRPCKATGVAAHLATRDIVGHLRSRGTVSSALPVSPLSTVVDNCVDVPSRWSNATRTVNGTQSNRNEKRVNKTAPGGAR